MTLSRKNEVDMLSGPIVKGLLKIAIPIMIMNVLQSLFSIADMTILKIFDTDGGRVFSYLLAAVFVDNVEQSCRH